MDHYQLDLKNKSKCSICNRKIPLASQYACSCGNFYCSKHKMSFDHNCSTDYFNVHKKKLSEKMTKIPSGFRFCEEFYQI